MNEQHDSADYLDWLSSLRPRDKVAIVGKLGIEIGHVQYPGKIMISVVSETSPGGYYYFYKASGNHPSMPELAGEEQLGGEFERRLVPLTPERQEQALVRSSCATKAGMLSRILWGNESEAVVDTVIDAYVNARMANLTLCEVR